MISKVLHKKPKVIDGIIKKEHNGYYFVKVGINWMPEHILVVEEKIGRILEKGNVIHHIDGNKINNKIENLMLFKTQIEHSAFHIKINKEGYTPSILKQIENRWKEFGK